MKKNVVLVGLMGAGKTSVGQELAQKLSYEFWDTDAIIEQTQGVKISEIFKTKGEVFFRELEKATIAKISQEEKKVISTGGGSLEQIENLKNLKKNGLTVYLKASPETLFSRVITETHRPLLQTENPLAKLEELLEKREKNYLLSDIIVLTENKTIDEIANEIIEVFND